MMKGISLRIFCLSLCCVFAGTFAYGQVTFVENGKPKGKIIVTTSDKTDMEAAELMRDFTKRISGVTPDIISATGNPGKNNIVIGNGGTNNRLSADKITEDGFLIDSRDGNVRILTGGDKGSVYGVVTLLEKYFGVRYWAEGAVDIPQTKTMEVPAVSILENPAFRYRQSQNYGLHTDPLYKTWLRLEEPGEVFAGGYWVHTFDALLPSAKYGESNPEYYSYFNGKRNPGKASQWCLTNPEVLEIVTEKLDSIFKANPDKHIISVSQNDGNYTNCTCDSCREIDEREGALSGSLIYFMNKLAERFPDKEISTLAYLYTMKPPKYIKPLPNVNIMLCSIDCDREVTLTENASGMEFYKAMEGWSAISDNIFVWDYGINFDCYLAPFPNFHVLQDNIRSFREHNVTMHFSQIASSRGGDFAEMRTWLVSKLMWDPDQDMDVLIHTFLDGYYGDAAPYIYQYIKLQEGALLGSGKRLWIYDSPVSHKEGILRPTLMRRYNKLFDKAEQAVAGDKKYLDRVRLTRVPLLYSELELDRTETGMDVSEVMGKLDRLENLSREFNIPTINERSNSPIDYCELYKERYLPKNKKSLAAGADIKYIVPPTGRYAQMGKTALVDELFGGPTFGESWVGWEGVDGEFIIDMKEVKKINTIDTDFLHQLGAWILLPTKVEYFISTDGKKYTASGVYDIPEDRDVRVKYVNITHDFSSPVDARYVKVKVTGTKICPGWHYGVGNTCWFFIDEVSVF